MGLVGGSTNVVVVVVVGLVTQELKVLLKEHKGILQPLTPDRETRVRSSAGSVCCFLEHLSKTHLLPKSTGNTQE